MITVTGRLVAAVIATAAGAFVVALGVLGAVTNRLTVRDVIAGSAAILVGAVAALWLRRDRLNRGKR